MKRCQPCLPCIPGLIPNFPRDWTGFSLLSQGQSSTQGKTASQPLGERSRFAPPSDEHLSRLQMLDPGMFGPGKKDKYTTPTRMQVPSESRAKHWDMSCSTQFNVKDKIQEQQYPQTVASDKTQGCSKGDARPPPGGNPSESLRGRSMGPTARKASNQVLVLVL